MTIELIQTKESDGDWYKVKLDGNFKACVKIYPDDNGKALERATAIYDFIKESKGDFKVIKSEVI